MRDLTYPPVIAAVTVAFKALGWRLELRGADHIPTEGGAVLAVNHISYIDFILGGWAARPSRRLVRFMAKRELFEHRWVGPLMRSLHHIEVDRANGQASYEQAVRLLRASELVGVFPEATISRSLELKPFKTGAVRMAVEASVPIVPLVLWGTQRVYTKDHPRDFTRGHEISLTVGAPIRPRPADVLGQTEQLRATMGGLLGEAIRRDRHEPHGQWWAPASVGGTAPSPQQAERLDDQERARRTMTH